VSARPAQRAVVRLACGIVLAWSTVAPVARAQTPKVPAHPYKAFAPWLETSVRFVSDVTVPGGPTFNVKVYDWVIGPRREVPNFPLEGFATMQLISGEVETTIGGTRAERRAGEFWVVAAGTKFGLKVVAEKNLGDNLVILRGVVLIRR
jgi:quercetin dioxygenase-like cupin family protein